MKTSIVTLLGILLLNSCTTKTIDKQEQTTGLTELDTTLEWYHNAKFGMFIHWGLASIPGKYMWYRYTEHIPDEEYRSLAEQFNPTEFNAETWVLAAKSTGMKWITITAKHHDGFAIYDSEADGFSINATPFGQGGRDPVKELAAACKKHGIKLGFYYSHYQDWDHPGGGAARITYDDKSQRPFRQYMDEKALPQVKELLSQYGEIAVMWFDTPMHLSDSEADEFRDLVRQTSPGTLIGGRLDDATGDFWSIPDGQVPGDPFGEPWETCMTSTHRSWGWTNPLIETRPAREMIEHLCEIVSRGGNFLLNTGPSPTGELNENDLAEYKKVGAWLKVNGEAIYGTEANPYSDSCYLCTTNENKIYFHLFEWPEGPFKIERLISNVKKIWLLADPQQKPLEFNDNGDVVSVKLPAIKPDAVNSILVVETEGIPVVENSHPAEDSSGVVNIPAENITIIDENFSSLDEERGELSISDTRRAWVNASFEVHTPGKYQIVISQSIVDSCNNNSYWIKVNGEKYTVMLDSSANPGTVTDQRVGIVEFENPGVFCLTIRPTDWYIRTDKVLVNIRNIQFLHEKSLN